MHNRPLSVYEINGNGEGAASLIFGVLHAPQERASSFFGGFRRGFVVKATVLTAGACRRLFWCTMCFPPSSSFGTQTTGHSGGVHNVLSSIFIFWYTNHEYRLLVCVSIRYWYQHWLLFRSDIQIVTNAGYYIGLLVSNLNGVSKYLPIPN